MKDSQRTERGTHRENKYIKESNERFSTVGVGSVFCG